MSLMPNESKPRDRAIQPYADIGGVPALSMLREASPQSGVCRRAQVIMLRNCLTNRDGAESSYVQILCCDSMA